MAGDLPSAVLFACTQNVIRSVMAAAIMKHFYGQRVYVASCGVRPGTPDPFVATVMDEMGIDLGKHRPQGFEDLEDSSFDLVVSLSPEAHHRALEMTRTMAMLTEAGLPFAEALRLARDQAMATQTLLSSEFRLRVAVAGTGTGKREEGA